MAYTRRYPSRNNSYVADISNNFISSAEYPSNNQQASSGNQQQHFPTNQQEMYPSGNQQAGNQQASNQWQGNSTQSQQVPEQNMGDDVGNSECDQDNQRPAWMKSKLQGVKKVPTRERRRRQNENLRRLLSPKNALMVLNEMLPGEQIAQQFKVNPTPPTNNMARNTFCADLTVNDKNYRGYGENKMSARTAAAEQAIRDLILKRIQKPPTDEPMGDDISADSAESLPMIQLASFALHKLFSEWENAGHKVPQLKPNWLSESVLVAPVQEKSPKPVKVKKPRELPANAATMHPCMLLTYMRPGLEYVELGVEGDKPQNTIFTMGVTVDGNTYSGRASNKKEARKEAARSACCSLFDIKFQF